MAEFTGSTSQGSTRNPEIIAGLKQMKKKELKQFARDLGSTRKQSRKFARRVKKS